MTDKIRIVYVGYHIETLLLLNSDNRFDVIGTGLIEEFLSVNSLNPVNALFKTIYRLRCRNQYRLLEKLLMYLWNLTSGLASSFYTKYSDYLKALSESRTEIVDLSSRRDVTDYLRSNRVDLLVVCVWSILSEEVLTLPKYGTINIHPSKLPQYRGALPTLWSLKNGDRESAVTYFIMNRAIDAGAIVGQHTFPIREDDDWYSLEVKINGILQATLLTSLSGYVSGEIKPVAQDAQIASKTGKYCEYMKIEWDKETGKDIYNKVNLYPYIVPEDYCYAIYNGRNIAFKKIKYTNSPGALTRSGRYHVKGLTLTIQAKRGSIVCNLLSGLRFKDSIFFFINRKGDFY